MSDGQQLGEQNSPKVTGLDLTKLDVRRVISSSSGPTPAEAANLEAKPYDPAPDRENIRGKIAQAFVWTLVCVIAAVVVTGLATMVACHAKDVCSADTTELKTVRVVVDLVLTPLIGLVGAVTGLYFGEKSTSARGA
jgi:hypothetical protein